MRVGLSRGLRQRWERGAAGVELTMDPGQGRDLDVSEKRQPVHDVVGMILLETVSDRDRVCCELIANPKLAWHYFQI